jgi:hypothetical protein
VFNGGSSSVVWFLEVREVG